MGLGLVGTAATLAWQGLLSVLAPAQGAPDQHLPPRGYP